MSAHHILIAVGGAAASAAVTALAQTGLLHKGAVAVTEMCMAASDAVNGVTQSIMDDATDRRAEARRQAKIDAAVQERLQTIEPDIRKEVTEIVDGATA